MAIFLVRAGQLQAANLYSHWRYLVRIMQSPFRRRAVILVLAFGFALMSVLVVQQERTIDSQRVLIRQLFRDSLELNAMRIQQVQSAEHR